MGQTAQHPRVVLVGRTNVGKSTLFNRLINEKKSIVFEREGVTRDYIQSFVTWNNITFELIDTGGITFKKNVDDIWKKVQDKVLDLLNSADILLFVCDGKNGLMQEDRTLAKIFHKTHKPVFLLINKADNQRALEDNLPEFYALGFKTIIPVSGIHGIGIRELLDAVINNLPTEKKYQEQSLTHKITIIGKPNVGKSSLMNLLVKYERSIVSDIAGTTREAVAHTVFHCSDLIQITDTAGVRRQARVNDDLETLMVKSSFEAVRTADTILVMIDASQGKISDQELKLLFFAYENKKNILVLFNKTDLLDEYTRQTLDSSIDEYKFIFNKIPLIMTSCVTTKNIPKIMDELKKLWTRNAQEFNSTEVNELVQEELKSKPLYHSRIQLKVFKIRHVQARVPTFVLHVNYPLWFGPDQLGCIENILRSHYDLKGCPVQLSVRSV